MSTPQLALPSNLEVEQALLGSILLNNAAFDRVADFLRPAHFFIPVHQRMFEVIGNLLRDGRAVNANIVKTFMPDKVDGGLTADAYLDLIYGEATSIINAAEYGRIVYDLAIRRDLIVLAEEARDKAYKSRIDERPADQIVEIERRLYQLAENGNVTSDFVPFATALTETMEVAARAYQRDGGIAGLATGLIDLDHKVGGLQDSDLIILAGRPGMGKTALATNIAFTIAKRRADGNSDNNDGRGIVGFFSLEMSREQLANRIIAEQCAIPSNRIRRGDLNEDDMARLADKAHELSGLPLYIDETGGLSMARLAARARRLKRRRGLDLIVVDYLQLMRGSDRKQNDNRVMEVTEITAGLKGLAKELNVPVLALSQLSRQVESREDKRPQLADLRESGSIEQDADVVLFVFREEYYVQMRKPSETSPKYAEWMADADRAAGKAEVIIAKDRHGPTGTVDLQFQADITKFSNLAS